MGGHPKGQNIDAAIGLAGGDVARAGDAAAIMVPGHIPLAGALLDGSDDIIRDTV